MKKLGFSMLLLAIAVMLGETGLAQGDNSYYFTTHYSNANTVGAPDATVRIINDGDTGGNLEAGIYVFDDSEELQECCGCFITPDGILSESVNNNLTANPLTGIMPTRGVIKVVSFDVTHVNHPPGLHVWGTHIQGTKVTLSPGNPVVPVVTGPYFVTETPAADSNLAVSELNLLENLCYSDFLLGGKQCSCQPEDYDF
jgi:hypothetical protein